MKKSIFTIALISLLSHTLVLPNSEVKTFRTNEIIVLSEDKQIEKTSSSIEFTLDNANRNKHFTLDNLLNEITGLQSARNSKNEGYFRLRGLDQRQIGIFFDGIPIVNQYDGMVDLSQYTLSSVSKIAVSKGLSSALYGANNLGGSINIITDNVFSRNLINASVNYGNFTQKYGIGGKQKLGDFYFTIAAEYCNFDNFSTSSNFDRKDKLILNSYGKSLSGFAKIANQIGNSFIHSLSFMIGKGEKGIPVNLETTRPRYWKMPEWDNIITNYATNFVLVDNVIFRTNLFAIQSSNIIDSYDDSTYSTQNSRFAFHSSQKYAKFGGSAIAEINWKNFEQTKFAISFHSDNQEQQSNSNEAWKKFRSQLISFSAEQNFAFNNFGGLLVLNFDNLIPTYANDSALRPSESFLNYQGGINYTANNFNIFVNYAHKSRFPTLKEFYAEVIGTNKPNPNLQSEFSDNFEFSFRTTVANNLKFRSSIYANFVQNLIDIKTLPDKTRQFANIGKVLFAGIEIDANYNIDDLLINFAFNFQKSENQTEGSISKIMPLRPEFTTNLTLSRYFEFGLNAQVQLQSYYNQYAYNFDKKEYLELPNYNLINVSLSYQLLKNIAVNATFMNILDQIYYSDWGYPQIGFNFNLGLNLTYN